MTASQATEQLNSKRLNLEKATNFMRQFRDPDSRELKKLSANQFMEVWSHYDKDGKEWVQYIMLVIRVVSCGRNHLPHTDLYHLVFFIYCFCYTNF